jgi:hypothetical protein
LHAIRPSFTDEEIAYDATIPLGEIVNRIDALPDITFEVQTKLSWSQKIRRILVIAKDRTVSNPSFPVRYFSDFSLLSAPIYLFSNLVANVLYSVDLDQSGVQVFAAALVANTTIAGFISANTKPEAPRESLE